MVKLLGLLILLGCKATEPTAYVDPCVPDWGKTDYYLEGPRGSGLWTASFNWCSEGVVHWAWDTLPGDELVLRRTPPFLVHHHAGVQ